MTEEDTFNRLKRPSYTQIRIIIHEWIHDQDDWRLIHEVLTDNHWDPNDYNNISEITND